MSARLRRMLATMWLVIAGGVIVRLATGSERLSVVVLLVFGLAAAVIVRTRSR